MIWTRRAVFGNNMGMPPGVVATGVDLEDAQCHASIVSARRNPCGRGAAIQPAIQPGRRSTADYGPPLPSGRGLG